MAAKRKRKIKTRKFVEIPEGAFRVLAVLSVLWACFWLAGLSNACPEPVGAYYSIALEWFCLFALPVGIGLSGAVSSMISLRLERGSVASARRVVSTAVFAGFLAGLASGLALFFCSGFLMKAVLGNSDAAFVLQGFAPALPFLFPLLALAGGLDGFGGSRAFSLVKAVFFLLVAAAGSAMAGRMSEYGQKVGALLQNDQYGPAYGALGGALSVALAAVLAFFVALIAWWRMQPDLSLLQWGDERVEKRGQLLAGLVKKLLPVLSVAKAHAAHADARDFQLRIAKLYILHPIFLLSLCAYSVIFRVMAAFIRVSRAADGLSGANSSSSTGRYAAALQKLSLQNFPSWPPGRLSHVTS